MIRAGRLRDLLFIQEPKLSYGNADGYQNIKGLYRLRCEFIKAKSGREKQADSGTFALSSIKIRARYRHDLLPSHQLSDGKTPERVFDIVDIDNVENRNIEMIITLEEITRG